LGLIRKGLTEKRRGDYGTESQKPVYMGLEMMGRGYYGILAIKTRSARLLILKIKKISGLWMIGQ